MVVDDGLSLRGRGLTAQDTGAQARGLGKEADGFQVRIQVGGGVTCGLSGFQLGGDHLDHCVGVPDQRVDRQCRVG